MVVVSLQMEEPFGKPAEEEVVRALGTKKGKAF